MGPAAAAGHKAAGRAGAGFPCGRCRREDIPDGRRPGRWSHCVLSDRAGCARACRQGLDEEHHPKDPENEVYTGTMTRGGPARTARRRCASRMPCLQSFLVRSLTGPRGSRRTGNFRGPHCFGVQTGGRATPILSGISTLKTSGTTAWNNCSQPCAENCFPRQIKKFKKWRRNRPPAPFIHAKE